MSFNGELASLKYSPGDILKKRSEVMDRLLEKSSNIKDGTITSISVADLQLLFDLYDSIFLHNRFKNSFKGKLKFSLSGRMTRSAGLTLCPKNIGRLREEDVTLEIRMGVDFFLHYGSYDGGKAVSGIRTTGSLEALMLVFEHELCHVLEFLIFKQSSCGRKRFKAMAYGLFGHTESHHRLPTNRQIAKQKLGLNLGDTVSFSRSGTRYTGILYRINKRATVMVADRDGSYKDRKGVRYRKYYVPLLLLE